MSPFVSCLGRLGRSRSAPVSLRSHRRGYEGFLCTRDGEHLITTMAAIAYFGIVFVGGSTKGSRLKADYHATHVLLASSRQTSVISD
jgi:hypothetical protein